MPALITFPIENLLTLLRQTNSSPDPASSSASPSAWLQICSIALRKSRGKAVANARRGATNSFAVTTSSVAAHQAVLTDEESLSEPRPKWTNNPALVLHWRPDAIPADASQLTITGEGSL